MELAKFDELDSLIKGILYIEQANPNECYYWSNPAQPEESVKTHYDFSKPYPFLVGRRKHQNRKKLEININIYLKFLMEKNYSEFLLYGKII